MGAHAMAEIERNEAPELAPASILAVIPTLNEERHIETCIRSLMREMPSLRVPLVVADGGSTDKTVEIVERLKSEFPNLQLIHNPKKLQAAAMNLAVLTQARRLRSYIVRCDAHSIYPADFILSVAKALKATGAASVVIPMDAVGDTCFERANAWIVDTPLGSGGSVHRGGKISGYVDHGHHAGFNINMYRQIGGYDETFSHNEDAEYDERVAQAGGKIFLDAEIRIRYIPRGSVSRWRNSTSIMVKAARATCASMASGSRSARPCLYFALLASAGGLLASPVFLPALILPLGYASACSPPLRWPSQSGNGRLAAFLPA
jgi:succinoglycan biosynthesis protein ExoA